jgi:YVTN family beta-propeller protein
MAIQKIRYLMHIGALCMLFLTAWSEGSSPMINAHANQVDGHRSPAAKANQENSRPPAPTLASTCISVSSDGSQLLATNPDSDSVAVVDTASYDLIAEIPVGTSPDHLALSPDGKRAFISNRGSDDISIVDLDALAVTDTITAGDRPAGLAISADGKRLAVALSGEDRVVILNPADLSVEETFEVDDRPYGLAFTPDGHHILASHLLSGQVSVITYPSYQLYLPMISSPGGADRADLLRSEDVKWLSASRSALIFPVQTISTWPNVAPAASVLPNSAGTRAYLPQTMANGLGFNMQFDTTVFPKISVINLTNYTHQTSEHISLPETVQPVGLPWAVALTKNESELWVVNSASNDVSVVDISNPSLPKGRANIAVGANPRGIALSPDGAYAYVNNTLDGTISVIEATTYTLIQTIPVTHIPLPPALLHGKRQYFSSATPDLAMARWISCNTCHVEGEHDGRTWKIQYLGEVPPGQQHTITRNTTSLLGMIETYPLRWSAEWNESADSEFSIRFEQFGQGLIDGEMHPTLGTPNQGRSYDLDCLALFIDSLAIPRRTHTLDEAELRGKAIFESPPTRCAECHPAPLYTDLQVHDVGTADGPGEWFGPLIDTPTLRFLYDSAPYLHDGSAATLLDVLRLKNAADEHGVTSQLSAQEIDDLIAFLLALPYRSTP